MRAVRGLIPWKNAQKSLILGFVVFCGLLSISAPVLGAIPAEKSRGDVEKYLEANQTTFLERLKKYNVRHSLAISTSGVQNVFELSWEIHKLEGDLVHLVTNYVVGRPGWNSNAIGRYLFVLQWRSGHLQFVSHGPPPQNLAQGGAVLPSTFDNGCVYNYFAANPCPDAKRKWTEFAEFHGLPLDGSSAAIFQAYKQADVATGDRLMARARGLPDPVSSSAFRLQGEVHALNLSSLQTTKNPCDLNPFGARPCRGIRKVFEDFSARYHLPQDRSTASMLESYAQGDFRRADVGYALAKNLPVPRYGYAPTFMAAEVMTLKAKLPPHVFQRKVPCDLNPYGTRPCPEIIGVWRKFAKRYELADNAANAAIFETYAAGEARRADQLFAQAKGVSLEQLLDAAGAPKPGLVIEVYPGKRRGKSSEFKISGLSVE